MVARAPSLDWEFRLGYPRIRLMGIDEVGRGCLAGPVAAGALVLPDTVDYERDSWLREVADSKLLTPEKRERLAPLLEGWAAAYGVGTASREEIDRLNIFRASQLAMVRAAEAALRALAMRSGVSQAAGEAAVAMRSGVSQAAGEAAVAMRSGVSQAAGEAAVAMRSGVSQAAGEAAVAMRSEVRAIVDGKFVPNDLPCVGTPVVKGDLKCLSVAAASVLAKVWRDRHLGELDRRHPGYGFAVHKGYSTPAHREALGRLGPCPEHRRSFEPIARLLAVAGTGRGESTSQIGQEVEKRAAEWYLSRHAGARVVETGFRWRGGEIDLIVEEPAARGTALVFIEVRARRGGAWFDGIESVDRRKRTRIEAGAKLYLARYAGTASEVRLDVVAWDGRTWSHLPGAWEGT